MIKIGKYTAALLLVTVGVLLLLDLTMKTALIEKAIPWWPVILISVGLEYLILGTRHRDPDKKLSLAFGSLALSVVLSLVVVGYSQGTTMLPLKDLNLNLTGINLAEETGQKFEKEPLQLALDDRIVKVSVKNKNGDVTVREGDVSKLTIDVTVYVHQSKKDEADAIAEASIIEANHSGNTMTIEAKGKKYRLLGLNHEPRMNMVITVPQDDGGRDYQFDLLNGDINVAGIAIRESIKGDTTNGKINLQHLIGDIQVDTTNGKIVMTDIQGYVQSNTTNGNIEIVDVDGDINVDTTNGSITVTRVTGLVKADTTNGSITLTDVEQGVNAQTTNGSITARTDKLGGDWKLETTHSKIQVYLPEDASFEVDGEGGIAGSISTNFPLNVKKDEIKGSVNGGTYKIELETIGGIGVHKN